MANSEVSRLKFNDTTYEIADELARENIGTANTKINSVEAKADAYNTALSGRITNLENSAGAVLVAKVRTDMIDTNKIYVYTGTTTTVSGVTYIAGHWYFHNGSGWTDGGAYTWNLDAIDDTLTLSNKGADAKVVGGRFSLVESDVSDLKSALNYNHTAEPGYVLRATNTGHGNEWAMVGTPTDAQAEEAINKWLDDHPEATTTVQDWSLSNKKLVKGTLGFITPEMYGAIGDGYTVDSDAINDAILACAEKGIPLFMCGTYLVDYNKPIIISSINGLTVIGKDAEIKLKNQTSVLSTGKYYLIEINNCTNIEISGITFNGNRDNLGLSDSDKDKPNHLADGIYIVNSSDIYIHDNTFNKFIAFGIYCMSSVSMSYTDPNISKLRIIGNKFNYCMNGVKIIEGLSDKIEFNNNVCLKMDTHGISFYPTATNIIVSRNIIEAGCAGTVNINGSAVKAGSGVRLYETNNVIVDSNIIISAAIAGIDMRIKPTNPVTPENVIITNNIIESSDSIGIYLQGATNAILSGNTVRNTVNDGIYGVMELSQICGNIIENVRVDNFGIRCFGSNNKIDNNTLNNCGSYSIFLSGGDASENNMISGNTIIAEQNLLCGINLTGKCSVGFNKVVGYANAPYFENNDNIDYVTPRHTYNATYNVDTFSGSSIITGLIDGMPSVTIPQDCSVVELRGYVAEATTTGTLILRIYRNGSHYSALEVNLSEEQTVIKTQKKGRTPPYDHYLLKKGDVLTATGLRNDSYLPGNTTATIQLTVDFDQ